MPSVTTFPAATSGSPGARLGLRILWHFDCRFASSARPRVGVNLLGQKWLAAFGTYHDGIEVLSALAVLMQQWPTPFVDHVGVSPMYDRHHDRIKVEPLLCQNIL